MPQEALCHNITGLKKGKSASGNDKLNINSCIPIFSRSNKENCHNSAFFKSASLNVNSKCICFIDLFDNGGQIKYSFILMLISPTSLAAMSKFQKNICFKTRAVGLINIKTKECKSGRHL